MINNVGGSIWFRPYQEYGPEEIEAEVRRSLFPTLWCCRAVLPYMIEAGAGTIVNVRPMPPGASTGCHMRRRRAASTRSRRRWRWRPPRTVSASSRRHPAERKPRNAGLRAGPSGRRLEREWYQQIVDQVVDSSLMKRYGTLDEQAAAITFLASDEASYITGTVLPVAGGDLG